MDRGFFSTVPKEPKVSGHGHVVDLKYRKAGGAQEGNDLLRQRNQLGDNA